MPEYTPRPAPRLLWMYMTPGLSGKIIEQEAKALGVKDVQMMFLTDQQVEALRSACLKRIERSNIG